MSQVDQQTEPQERKRRPLPRRVSPKDIVVADGEVAVTYIPFGEAKEITLTETQVLHWFSKPTADGFEPARPDLIKFLVTCQSARLNPYKKEAYLVGYDSKDGPSFDVITSVWALHKRASGSGLLGGYRSGVIIRRKDGAIAYPIGAWFDETDVLLGAWGEVHRKDIPIPFTSTVKRTAYDTGKSRWAKDPGGMIEKCALAAALKKAFPLEVDGVYVSEEMDAVYEQSQGHRQAMTVKPGMDGLEAVLGLGHQQAGFTIDPATSARETMPVEATNFAEQAKEAQADVAKAEPAAKPKKATKGPQKQMDLEADSTGDAEGNDPRPLGERSHIARALGNCGDTVQEIDSAVASLMNEFRWTEDNLAFMRKSAEQRKLGG